MREQGLARPGRAHQQNALGDLPAEALELLRVLEKLDDLLEFLLGLVDSCNVSERHLLLVGSEKTGLGFTKGHGLGAAGLHLPEEDEPQSDEDEQRCPPQKGGEHSSVGWFFNLDLDLLRPQIPDQIVVPRVVGVEVVAWAGRAFIECLGGSDEDLVALDQDPLDLSVGNTIEQLRK